MAVLKVPGLAGRIRDLFETQPLNQTKFCKATGLNQQNFSGWLRGTTPDWAGLSQLADIFDAPWEWLLVGKAGAERALDFEKKGGIESVRAAFAAKQEGERRRSKKRSG